MRRNNSHNPIANIVPRAAWMMLALAAAIGASWMVSDQRAQAHEGRVIGPYYFDVGFITEPAYEGHLNGVALRVNRIVSTDSDSGSDDDSHDDHAHGAMDDDDAHRDVTVHGAHFQSGGVDNGGTYQYVIPGGMEDLTIPYHTHPRPFEGDIAVLDGTGSADNHEIRITSGGLEPNYVEVMVGDTISWLNDTGANAAIMSGPHASMTDEILTETLNMIQTGGVALGPAVTGLSVTLEVEVTHVPSSASITLSLIESETVPGYYEAPFLPTATGEYKFRFRGVVEELAIDEEYTSSPSTFDSVIPGDQIEFPDPVRSARELENAVSGARDNAATALEEAERGSNSANIALGLGIVAILAGLAGAALGGYAFLTTRARQE